MLLSCIRVDKHGGGVWNLDYGIHQLLTPLHMPTTQSNRLTHLLKQANASVSWVCTKRLDYLPEL